MFVTAQSTLCLLLVAYASAKVETAALDEITFYSPSTVTSADNYRTAVVKIGSLNAGLWAAANTTMAETPFIHGNHVPGLESVLNLSASACSAAYTNLTNIGGVATLPVTATGPLQAINGLTYDECVRHCCLSIDCVAWDWYSTTDEGFLCQTYQEGYTTGPQPWPAGHVLFAQGGEVTGSASQIDNVANGLRSGTFLGGIGTGGYEIRADGTFHLSTLRNQAPSGEPWHGVVRDAVLAVSINGQAHVVRVKPFGNLTGVPHLIYSDRFPLAMFEFSTPALVNLRLYAYSALTPGDDILSNTPAVVYTLHATNSHATPLNITFAIVHGFGLRNDWTQLDSAKASHIPGVKNLTDCAASCARANARAGNATCYAWEWNSAQSTCFKDTSGYALGANRALFDSGFPGAFSFTNSSVVFTTAATPSAATKKHNGLGSQGFFVPPPSFSKSKGGSKGGSTSVSYGVGSGNSVAALLSTLKSTNPSKMLTEQYGAGAAGVSASAAGAAEGGCVDCLFAGASVSVQDLEPARSVSMTLQHAWHYPIYYW
jgi:hypothetical protein